MNLTQNNINLIALLNNAGTINVSQQPSQNSALSGLLGQVLRPASNGNDFSGYQRHSGYGQGGGSNSLLLQLLLGNRQCKPAPKPAVDPTLSLLLSLLGGGGSSGGIGNILSSLFCGNKPAESPVKSIIDLLFPPSHGTGGHGTGSGDPHMNLPGVGAFEFQGPSTATPGTDSNVRLLDSPDGSAINVGLRHLDYKLPGQNTYASFFHDFAGKLGNSKFAIDADAKKLTLDGQEVAVGQGKAVALGNGESATVSRPDENTFVINTGRQILTAKWQAINTAGAKGYFDIDTQVTAKGLDDKAASGGLMNLGHVGLSADKLKEIVANQDTIYSLFKVGALDDLAGQRVPEGGKASGKFAGETATGTV